MTKKERAEEERQKALLERVTEDAHRAAREDMEQINPLALTEDELRKMEIAALAANLQGCRIERGPSVSGKSERKHIVIAPALRGRGEYNVATFKTKPDAELFVLAADKLAFVVASMLSLIEWQRHRRAADTRPISGARVMETDLGLTVADLRDFLGEPDKEITVPRSLLERALALLDVAPAGDSLMVHVPDATRGKLIEALATMPDEVFGWFVLACPVSAMLNGGRAQIWPDGMGGFSSESQASVEAVRQAAEVWKAQQR